MRRLAIALAVTAALAAPASAAQDSTPAAPDAGAPAGAPAPEIAGEDADFDLLKIVCRKVRPPTGTRVVGSQTRQRMCMTKADWEQQELDAQEAFRERDTGICARKCRE